MDWAKRIIFSLFRLWTGRLAFLHVKRRGLLIYLRTLQTLRRSLIAAIVFACCLQLMVIGAVGAFIAGVLLSEQETTSKLWILFAGFLVIFGLPFITLFVIFSERVWLKASGAENFFEGNTAPSSRPLTDP